MRNLLILMATIVPLIALGACSGDDGHAEVNLEITVTPAAPILGQVTEIEVSAHEGETHVMPEEVHVVIQMVGSTDPTEIAATAGADHHFIEYTFTAPGTYDITAEAHMGDSHHEPVTHTVQVVVQ